MGERDGSRSRELDEVRRMLFPDLGPEEGWSRIDRATAAASDEERWSRIEKIVRRRELDAELLDRVRTLTDEPSD